ncbi:MAG: hypothetical protein LBH03_00910 [Holophagales bacterium]|jgi:hypothetical protein|nr:hypothetical protein [Holophagales bacterium]
MRAVSLIIYVLLMRSWLWCWTPEHWFESPKSNRVVHYDIKGVLDWQKKIFEGRMKLTWRNSGTSATQDLPFHLYLNAFRHPDTSFMRANASKSKKNGADTWGYCEIKSAAINGNELSGYMGEDETVYWVHLPEPVKPNESIQIEVAWEARFPEIHAGSGWTDGYLAASMWYPKIGFFTGNQWICEPFHLGAMYSSDFGNFDVELSLPNALQLANTGTVITPLDESGNPVTDQFKRPVEATLDPDRRLNFVYKIHAEDVQDFSWIVALQGNWGIARLDFRDTQIFFYSILKNGYQLERLKKAVWSSLRYSEELFGAYPYPVLSIVDLPHKASSAVNSPTLAVISNVAFTPFKQHVVPEQIAIQKIGNQFFRGIIALGGSEDGSDKRAIETELAGWFTSKALERAYSALITSKRFCMEPGFSGWYASWPISLNCLNFDRCAMPHCLTANSHRQTSTVAVNQLEAILGRPVLEDIIRVYVTEKSFKHSKASDFRQIAERVSGRDLGSFWKNYIESCGILDYRIQSVIETSNASGTITLERLGSIAAPVTLWVRLKNGQEQSRTWNGEDKHATFSFDSPITAAVLDPGRNYPSLKSRMHSTYSDKPTRRGLHYWAQNIFGAIVGILQGIGVG